MKSLTMRLTIAAAALVAAAGVASAQTMEAKIPFAFRANGKVLAPGTYRVSVLHGASGSPLFSIAGRETGENVLALGWSGEYPKPAWLASGNAVLRFQCGADRCTLSELWMGNPGTPAYRISTPKSGKDDYHIVAEIMMHRVAGD